MIDKIKKSYFLKMFASYLLLGLVLYVILLFLLLIWTNNIVRNSMEEQTSSSLSHIIKNLDALLTHYTATVEELSEDEDILFYLMNDERGDAYQATRKLYMLNYELSHNTNIHVIRVGDASGISTSDYLKEYLNSNFISNRGVFLRANESSEPVLYTSVKSIFSHSDVRIMIAKAVYDSKNTRIGYIVVDFLRDSLDSIASNYIDMYHSNLMIVDKYDVILYNSLGRDMEGLGKFPASLSNDIWSDGRQPGTAAGSSYIWHKSTIADYAVYGEISSEILNTTVAFITSAALPSFLIIVVACFILAYFIAKSTSRPIRELSKAMSLVKDGNLDTKVLVSGNDEIGDLGNAFNDMTDRIADLVYRVEEEQRYLRIAEIKTLNLQINPHFLYNTLDLIKWTAKLNKPEETARITVHLGKLLRKIMNTQTDVVTVEYELDIVSDFLEIQKSRYMGRLEVTYDVNASVLGYMIPKLIMQALVENAIVHGLSDKIGVGTIHIRGYEDSKYLKLIVSDNGGGMSLEKLASVKKFENSGMYHIGLHNINERIKIYGDENCGIDITSKTGEGTAVTLTLLCSRQTK